MTSSAPPASRSAARAVNPLLVRSRHPLTAVVLAVSTLVILFAAGLVLRAHPIDAELSRALNSLRVGGVGHVAEWTYHALKPVPAMAVMIVATAVVWVIARRLALAAAFLGTVAITWVLSDLLKLVVDRPRPDVTQLSHHFAQMPVDASFPSGHVVFVTALAVTVIVMARRSRWFVVAVVAGVLLIALMSASVVIDGVHYPTDAAASILWVLGVLPLVRLVWVDLVLARIPFLRTPAAPGLPRA